MNTQAGLLGRKLGCSQVFDDEGNVHRVTVIEVGPCVITTKKSAGRDGYCALQIGFGEKAVRHMKKPQLAAYLKEGSPLKEKGISPHRYLKELRVPGEDMDKYEIGQTITVADIFSRGEFVDVTGTTKGRGFAGVIKRHGFHGAKQTHGTHEAFRHGGSIGQNMTPGRTFKGMKMPGHMGTKRQTTQNLKVVDVIPEDNILLVRGAVPGSKKGLVIVRKAVKKSKTAQQPQSSHQP
ncbi:MAG: 50S ribosomal protein L3 [Pseudomonadota bacterium]